MEWLIDVRACALKLLVTLPMLGGVAQAEEALGEA